MRNCFLDYEHRAIADLTNLGEVVPGTMTITRINVPEEHRGRGFGTKLLVRILDEADSEHVHLSLLVVPSGPLDYDALVSWYERHGFRQSERYPVFMVRPFVATLHVHLWTQHWRDEEGHEQRGCRCGKVMMG
jgi:ribosomal protein S18 acetylase RimI-like enzyme